MMLGGAGEVVEIDETLIGGSVSGKGSGSKDNKTCVVGMLERGGEVVATVISARHHALMEALVQKQIHPGATVATEEFGSDCHLDALGFNHVTVQHNKGQYTTHNGAA